MLRAYGAAVAARPCPTSARPMRQKRKFGGDRCCHRGRASGADRPPGPPGAGCRPGGRHGTLVSCGSSSGSGRLCALRGRRRPQRCAGRPGQRARRWRAGHRGGPSRRVRCPLPRGNNDSRGFKPHQDSSSSSCLPGQRRNRPLWRAAAWLAATGMVLDRRVGGGEEYALVAIAPADEIRRRAFLAMHLDDHGFAVLITYVMSPDHQLIANICSHRSSSFPPQDHHPAASPRNTGPKDL